MRPKPLVLDAFGKPIKGNDGPANTSKPISEYYVKKEKIGVESKNEAEKDKAKANVMFAVSAFRVWCSCRCGDQEN